MENAPTSPDAAPTSPDADMQAIVRRLARPSRAGGHVIERAAIVAEGSDFRAIEAWILEHGGKGETPPAPVGRGLFAERTTRADPLPTRYLLPAGTV